MDSFPSGDDASVKMSTRQRFGVRQGRVGSYLHRRDIAAGAVLLAHWSTRILTAVVIAVLQVGLLHRVDAGAGIDRTTIAVLVEVVAYALFVSAISLAVVRLRRRAPAWLVTLALFGDLLFIFTLTLTATSPEHYERALCGAIVVMHVAVGRRPSPSAHHRPVVRACRTGRLLA
jgi:hypothetical protein